MALVCQPSPVAQPKEDNEISLVLVHNERNEVLTVLPDETISHIKLRLRNRGWWSSRHCLVFGERELADHQRIQDVIAPGTSSLASHLHVFVKLTDVEAVAVRTLCANYSWDAAAVEAQPPRAAEAVPAKSALTESLQEVADAVCEPEAPSNGLALAKHGSFEHRGATVVHLVVHRGARMAFAQSTTSGSGKQDLFELSITSSDTADTLKQRIAQRHGSLPAGSHLLLYGGKELESGRPLSSYGIGMGSLLELFPVQRAPSDGAMPSGSPPLSSPAHELYENYHQARAGLAEGHTPVLASAGTGGSYFLKDPAGSNVAVFKPEDEEPLAANNPKGLASSPTGEGLRKGTRVGEGAVREVAAYLLDHGHFANVPPTALVSCALHDPSPSFGPATPTGGAALASSDGWAGADGVLPTATGRGSERKTGSLQQFVFAEGDCEERGNSAFPVHEVHKIAVLDIRLANTDRNGGNILARRGAGGAWELVPIDHGYTLPATFEDIAFEWLYWPQARHPFEPATLEYIAGLDAERDIALLANNGLALRPECLHVLRVCTALLQKGAAAGLTPYQLGAIMSRQALTKSALEKLHQAAQQRARLQQHGDAVAAAGAVCRPLQLAPDEDLVMVHFQALLDEYLDDFSDEMLDGDDDLLL